MKKYDSILRFGKRGTTEAILEKEVVVMEKLDGANASFRLVNGELKMFSRNQELDEHNTLRGFYDWAKTNIDIEKLEEDCIYFGEWLVTHTIQYKKENQYKFYLFDIYDVFEEYFVGITKVMDEAKNLNLEMPQVFFYGVIKDIKELDKYVGKSKLTEVPDQGEGIVVKNYDNYDVKTKTYHSFVKIVSDKFQETNKIKQPSLGSNPLDSAIESVLTSTRVEKLIHKKIDQGVLSNELDISDTGNVLKALGSDVVNDILEEEMHIFLDMLRKKISKKTPIIVRQLLEGGTWQ